MVKAKKYILSKHFVGFPKASDLELIEEELPQLNEGEFLAEAVFLSIDPYLRAYEPNLEIGDVFIGSQVARKQEFRFSCWKACNVSFWMEDAYNIQWNKRTTKGYGRPRILPDMGELPLSLALGVLGIPGNSAYFGLLEICQPKAGETVVVTAAGGAVGSHVGQIAKIKGCNVIGVAGDDKKGQWLVEELGFDHFINYKKTNLAEALTKYAPNGIDCYFDNVGGEISSVILQQMNEFGRVSVCGSITAYNSDSNNLPKATLVQAYVITKQLKMEGFYVNRWRNRWAEGIKQNLQWIKEGKLKYKETVTEGFENTFQAFINMLQGENVGKAIVKI